MIIKCKVWWGTFYLFREQKEFQIWLKKDKISAVPISPKGEIPGKSEFKWMEKSICKQNKNENDQFNAGNKIKSGILEANFLIFDTPSPLFQG